MAGLEKLNGEMLTLQQGMQTVVYTVIAIQAILSAAVLYIWYRYRKEPQMPAWAMCAAVIASLIATGVIAILIFLFSAGFNYYKTKSFDWSAIVKLHSLVSGVAGLVLALLALAAIAASSAIMGSVYGN